MKTRSGSVKRRLKSDSQLRFRDEKDGVGVRFSVEKVEVGLPAQVP